MKNNYLKGLKSGIPIGVAYAAISFTFGIMAISYGLYWWQALLISMVTLTSAGQVAAIKIMVFPGRYIEMLITQLTINVRYSFMSIALSQKIDSKFKGIFKVILGFFITDEIFAVAISEKNVSKKYFLGLATLPYFGWSIGTLTGAIIGNVLPESIINSLCMALYAMFIGSIVPQCEKNKKVLIIVILTAFISSLFYYMPYISKTPSGIAISISAVLAALIGAIFFKNKEDIADAK